MASLSRRLPGFALAALFAGISLAQTGQIAGTVKDENGQPLKDALIKIERQDIKGNYKVKTKKKGDYLHAGLPLGTYKVTVEVEGKDRDSVNGVRTKLGDDTIVDFDLHKQVAQQQAIQQAAETGTLTKEQERGMSAEQKAALEKQMKERSAAMAKNKELNEAFNAGMEARKTNNLPAAAEAFTKASEMDATQHVIWSNLAEAYGEMSKTATGPEKQADLDKSIAAYQKAMELNPSDAGYHNNFALVLARANKMPEMQAELDKAVALDAPNAGRYYYNMGAVLTNTGQTQQACEAFKKALDADANYADAHYQFGICLTSKATNKADGTIVFPEGTEDAFQKYLALKPDGPFADSAKGMLASMGTKVDTTYTAPGAKKQPAGKPPAGKKK